MVLGKWTRLCCALVVFTALMGATGCASTKPVTPGVPQLSAKEMRKAEEVLSDKSRQFLEDVEPIINDDEKKIFLDLHTDQDRDAFIERFWRVRSIDEQGSFFDFKSVYYERLNTIREAIRRPRADPDRWWLLTFRTMKSINSTRNPARIFLMNGPPSEVKKIECQDVTQPIQIWYYPYLSSLNKHDITLVFYQRFGFDYELWLPGDGLRALLVNPGVVSMGDVKNNYEDYRVIQRCPDWRDLLQALAREEGVLGPDLEANRTVSKITTPPVVSIEGVSRVYRMATDLDKNAPPLEAKLYGVAFTFARDNINKVATEISFLVPKNKLTTSERKNPSYDVDAVLQVVRNAQIVTGARFQFKFFAAEASDNLPVTVNTDLYPGEYTMIVKLIDANGTGQTYWKDNVIVPDPGTLGVKPTEEPLIPRSPFAPNLKLHKIFAMNLASPIALTVKKPEQSKEQSEESKEFKKKNELASSSALLIVAPNEPAIGVQNVSVRAPRESAFVEFFLDGVKCLKKNKAPFMGAVDLGPVPRKHILLVMAYDANGKEVARDEVLINQGTHSLKVAIISPGPKEVGKTKIQASIVVPDDQEIASVDFYFNDAKIASRKSEPWSEPIVIPSANTLASVRVVANLKDGSIAEDMHYVNIPGFVAGIEVNAVELYAAVKDGGRVAEGLTAKNFEVLEDGAEQNIETLAFATNTPLSLGLAVDTSNSMTPVLNEVIKAAEEFLDKTVRTNDRGFTMGFNTNPYMLMPATGDKQKLLLSLSNLRAEGWTAFYDAVVRGLYELQDLKGKKAFVILTDGRDEGPGRTQQSQFSYEDTLEYARHAGVPIYIIGFNIGLETDAADLRMKLSHIANDSGGKIYYVTSSKNLGATYEEINRELRSQYAIAYLSKSGIRGWRKVHINMRPSSLRVSTIPGYYP